MNKWLVQKCAVPNWLALLIAVLSIVSFATPLAKAGEFYVQKDIAESELVQAKCILETLDVFQDDYGQYFFSCGTCGLAAPFAAVFGFTVIQVGFLCVLGIIVGVGWVIFKNPEAKVSD